MRVAVVGAGPAGLASVRHVSKNGYHCDVFEMASELGGAWVYYDDTDIDKYGYPIYSPTYKGLTTNLPKEIMGYPDFPIHTDNPKSYLHRSEILHFLNAYADHFDLKQHIKFNRMVTDVRPLAHDKWQITSRDKPTHESFVDVYDAIMICSGHYNEPYMPTFPGQELFKGQQYHSRVYRTPEQYQGKNVLLVGGGPSGVDMAVQISTTANHVIFSHHSKFLESTFPPNVIVRPDVRVIKEHSVEFSDGSCDYIDVIYYCTGYVYHFPFLDDSCGITIEDNLIQPLYKHIINISKPTMGFIGMPFNVCTLMLFDLQARFFVNSLNGTMKLPSAEEMRGDTRMDLDDRLSKGYSKRQSHYMGPYERSYHNTLATLANTYDIPQVMLELKDYSVERLFSDLMNFRQDTYKIIDDHNFLHNCT